MALTQISTDGIKNGTITGSDLATNVDLVDDQKLRFGTSNDLQIYHDGSNSRLIDSGTGNLILQGSRIVLNNADSSENMVTADENGAVELYFDNTRKFLTTSTGCAVNGNLSFPNNGKAKFGASDDLEIYHDSSSGTNRIDSENRDLIIRRVGSATESMAQFKADGAVELYHDNSKKFETTSAGATITGDLTITDDLFVQDNIGLGDTDKIKLGDGEDLQIYHDGTYNRIAANAQIFLQNLAANETYIAAYENGQVEIYHDNSIKFQTTSSGVAITGGITTSGASTINEDFTFVAANGEDLRFDKSDSAFEFNDNFKCVFGNSSDLQIYHDGTNNYIEGNNQKTIIRNTSNNIHIQAVSGEAGIDILPNSAVKLYHNGNQKFETSSVGVNVTGTLSLPDGDSGETSEGGIKLGASGDLLLYHDGSNSYLKEKGTGDLVIIGKNNIKFLDYGTNQTMCKMVSEGAVELYHQDTKRFETTSYGAALIGSLRSYGHVFPNADNDVDLGTTSLRWRNIYTADLNLSNEGGANDVDSTWGSYTIQEGAEDLFLINRRNGKKYKFNLTEVS